MSIPDLSGLAEPKKCLFIGGPADGQYRSVPDCLQFIKIISQDMATFPNADGFDLASTLREVTYRRIRLSESLHIYALNSMTNDDALTVLLEGYLPVLRRGYQDEFGNHVEVTREMRENHRLWLEEVFGI